METRIGSAAEAAERLRAGEVVGLPTETVYGLGADAFNPFAAAKVFEVKERPEFDPLIVHLPDVEGMGQVASEVEPLAQRLAERFWPGPFTLVLPKRPEVPDLVTSGLETVAVRVSGHPVLSEVLALFGGPVAAPSANRFGRISPTRASDVLEELGGRIPLVVDGGPCEHGVESTIVAVRGGMIAVLRPGPVTAEMLGAFGEVVFPGASGRPVAPGQLPGHYAPRTPLALDAAAVPSPGERCGLLALRAEEGFAVVEALSPSGDLRDAAAKLFGALRRLDGAGLDRIIARPVPEEGIGRAIMDRLRRAAHG